ncbi:hypothetical protein BDV12DRAFT_199980 [Aspergillus spectabilis]
MPIDVDELDQQFIDDWLAFIESVRISRDANIVTVSNYPEDVEPDLQYLIFAPLLSHLNGKPETTSAFLETTARLFTAHILSHLPTPKTINHKFSIPEFNLSPFSGIRSAYHAILNTQDSEFPIGALHTFSATETNHPPLTASPQHIHTTKSTPFDETTSRVSSSKDTQFARTFGNLGGILGKLFGIYSKRATAISCRSRAVQLLHLSALIGLILAISGGTDQASSKASDQSSGKTETKTAIILFLLIYIALGIL